MMSVFAKWISVVSLVMISGSSAFAGTWTVEDAGSKVISGPVPGIGTMNNPGLPSVQFESVGNNFLFRSIVGQSASLMGYGAPRSFDFGEQHLHKVRLVWSPSYPGEPVPSGVSCEIGVKLEEVYATATVSSRNQATASVIGANVNLTGNNSFSPISRRSDDGPRFEYMVAPANAPWWLSVGQLPDGRWGSEGAAGGLIFEHHGRVVQNGYYLYGGATTYARLSSKVVSITDTNGGYQSWGRTW
jgi:hypothetical protein